MQIRNEFFAIQNNNIHFFEQHENLFGIRSHSLSCCFEALVIARLLSPLHAFVLRDGTDRLIQYFDCLGSELAELFVCVDVTRQEMGKVVNIDDFSCVIAWVLDSASFERHIL